MRTVYREKRYYCGEYLDAYIYPVFEEGKKGGKRKRRGESTEAQKKLNQRHREEKLARLLHANFTPAGIKMELTYSEQPESDEDAIREVQNYIRRVKRYAVKEGLGPVKYIIVTEKGSKKGRIHHHAVIEFEGKPDRDKLESLWTDWPGHGFVRQSHLRFNEEGLEGLARYTSKSPIGKKAWMASRNLVDPEPKIRDGRVSGRKAKEMQENPQDSTQFEKLYPGYRLAKAETFHNDVNGGHYICLRMYREDGKFIKPKKTKTKAGKGKKA